MPKQELQELREFIQETPGVSLSGLIRNGIKMQMVEIKNDSESVKSSYQSTKLFEIVSDLFRKDFGWEDR
jgi:hypothetical protein